MLRAAKHLLPVRETRQLTEMLRGPQHDMRKALFHGKRSVRHHFLRFELAQYHTPPPHSVAIEAKFKY